jgi:hypothetical protein
MPKDDSIKRKRRQDSMVLRKIDSRPTRSKGKSGTLFCQGTYRKKVNGRLRYMQAILQDKDYRSTTRRDTKTDSATSKGREKATVGSLHRDSLSRIIMPEKGAISNNMVGAPGIQQSIKWKNRGSEDKRQRLRHRVQGRHDRKSQRKLMRGQGISVKINIFIDNCRRGNGG